jgi:hypothetical protein
MTGQSITRYLGKLTGEEEQVLKDFRELHR